MAEAELEVRGGRPGASPDARGGSESPSASDARRSMVVGIAGGTGSGKSTLARRLARALGPERCAMVSQDNYYRDLSDLSFEARSHVNFDHPDSIEADLLAADLVALRQGRTVHTPRYDFSRHARMSGGSEVQPRPIVLVEGILVFVWPEVAELCDIKIFVDTADDVRLARRMRRDIADRGRDVDSVLNQYQSTVRPMHERFVAPTRQIADLVVPGHGDNQVVVKLLARALQDGLPD